MFHLQVGMSRLFEAGVDTVSGVFAAHKHCHRLCGQWPLVTHPPSPSSKVITCAQSHCRSQSPCLLRRLLKQSPISIHQSLKLIISKPTAGIGKHSAENWAISALHSHLSPIPLLICYFAAVNQTYLLHFVINIYNQLFLVLSLKICNPEYWLLFWHSAHHIMGLLRLLSDGPQNSGTDGKVMRWNSINPGGGGGGVWRLNCKPISI